MISIAELEPALSGHDLWARSTPDHSGPVETSGGEAGDSYEIEKLVRKRIRRTRGKVSDDEVSWTSNPKTKELERASKAELEELEREKPAKVEDLELYQDK